MNTAWRRLLTRIDTLVLGVSLLVALSPLVNGGRLVYRSLVTQPDQLRTLAVRGVPVSVTVRSCTLKLPTLPVSCTGTFRLDGVARTAPVSDVGAVPELPSTVECTVDPRDPGDVYPTAVVEVNGAGAELAYGPALFGGALVALGLVIAIYPWRLVRIVQRARRRRRRWMPHPSPPVPRA